MVQCEMCGAETSSPKTIKVEGAKLDVCSNCTDFGTEVKQPSSSSSSSKYSTSSSKSGSASSSSGGSAASGSSASSSGGSSSQRRSDMFDDMDQLATDYDERVRNAREEKSLSQSELANELNEKASLIRKIERGDTLPSDSAQSKLENFLEIDLSAAGSSGDESEWSGGSSSGSYTLGDVVKRKD
ncbi:multiprotein bridging factor aMBF1 [Natronorubrum daqingense]|uniref:TIGR00270 family protein n=1 Tax=Natronorubrum daqingense TaxID=588898 RepID=A0A1N7DN45_9EURY|nr:TIGR00270 family protein [Natronorubrum daqingense]SIR77247.1 transcriptional regulator, XRE family [Natronorubrum daqingense]